MIHNEFIKCGICSTIHRVRIQAGFLNTYPLVFNCGKCGAPIRGTVILNPNSLPDMTSNRLEGEELSEAQTKKALVEAVKLIPENNSLVEKYSPDDYEKNQDYFSVECSGELLVRKIEEIENKSLMTPIQGFSPYMRWTQSLGFEKQVEFINCVESFFHILETSWPSKRAVFEMITTSKPAHIIKAIQLTMDKDEQPCSTEAEILDSIRGMKLSLLPVVYDSLFADSWKRCIQEVLVINIEKVRDYIACIEGANKGIAYLRNKANRAMIEFFDKFTYLVPAYGMLYLDNVPDLNTYGATVCLMGDIESFYIACYETLAELLTVLIALDNIVERSDYDHMNKSNHAVKNFRSLLGVSKGNIYLHSDDGELTKLVPKCWNRNLRNALGHSSYNYISSSQMIEVIDKGTVVETIYLAQAMRGCVEMFRSICLIDEVLFFIQMQTLSEIPSEQAK